MLKAIWSMYSPGYVKNIVYMLQSNEYHVWPYLKWYWRTNNFNRVAQRRKLDKTPIAQLLAIILAVGMLAQITLGLAVIFKEPGNVYFGLALLIGYPVVWAHLITVPTLLGRVFIINRRNTKLSAQTQHILNKHQATIIAVAGSYGKTSMKELLKTVLSEGLKVSNTPANKNVITEHAKFARQLEGDEDAVILELGEEKPGDVDTFVKIIKPNIGVITGLAPAHLDRYKTIESAGRDIFHLAEFVPNEKAYINGDSGFVKPFIKDDYQIYTSQGIGSSKVSAIKIGIEGTRFTLKTIRATYSLKSGLIGKHHIGPLCAAVAIAEDLGLSKSQIEAGVANTKAYEHRMEPKLIAGAWVLDDTYNGTIEGMKAGLELLKDLEAKRKIYITPGLVDQGKQADEIHTNLGQYIAQANPDIVVLMRNSATVSIEKGINEGDFTGELIIQGDPVSFYTNLDKFVAVGDLVLMQNDWTDNYN